jgi:tetratricopeptide (TPR) repeat protein
MVDLLRQLAEAKSDEARQNAIFAHVIDGLPDEVRDAAMVLAVPHWLSQSIVLLLNEKIGDHFASLKEFGLLVHQPGETYSFPATVRALLLGRLITTDLSRFRSVSAQCSEIFLGIEDETSAARIESIYHALGADPTSGGRTMLEYGLLWKSEPFFQWDALDRLVMDADEQDGHGVLDDECRAYRDLLKLFVPRLRQSPKMEIQLLSRLQETVPDNMAFDIEVKLRLGFAELAIGDIATATARLVEALSDCEKAQQPTRAIEAYRGLARIALRQDNYKEASLFFESGRVVADRLGLIASGAHSKKGMAEIDFLQGRYLPAGSRFNEAIAQFGQTGARLGEANTRVSLAQLLALQHRFVDAHEHIQLATNIYLPVRQSLGLGNCFKALGLINCEQGLPEKALKHLAKADTQYAEVANQTGLAYSNVMKATALLALDRSGEAEARLDEAGPVFERLGDRYGRAMVKRERGRIAKRRKSFQLSLDLLSDAITTFDALHNPVESAVTFLAIADVAVEVDFPHGFSRETLIERVRSAATVFEENQLPGRLLEADQMLLTLDPKP